MQPPRSLLVDSAVQCSIFAASVLPPCGFLAAIEAPEIIQRRGLALTTYDFIAFVAFIAFSWQPWFASHKARHNPASAMARRTLGTKLLRTMGHQFQQRIQLVSQRIRPQIQQISNIYKKRPPPDEYGSS